LRGWLWRGDSHLIAGSSPAVIAGIAGRKAVMDAVRLTKCECGCGCGEDATTSDGGVALCAACAEYAVDPESGEVVCSRDPRAEEITECCGAGGQTRSYWRIRPPVAPAVASDGEWACYWNTVGDGSRVVSRHATEAEAARAVVTRRQWVVAGGHPHYLYRYEVRQWDGEAWVAPYEAE